MMTLKLRCLQKRRSLHNASFKSLLSHFSKHSLLSSCVVNFLLLQTSYNNMKVLLVINLLVVICVLLSESVTINELTQESLYYKDQIKILYQLLAAECPNELRNKREISRETMSSIKLRAQKLHYNNLLKTLSECKMKKQSQTTTQPTPVQCLSATNLTDSWRMDHNGQDLKGGGPNAHSSGWACDFRKSLQWFRFTGAAGKNETCNLLDLTLSVEEDFLA